MQGNDRQTKRGRGKKNANESLANREKKISNKEPEGGSYSAFHWRQGTREHNLQKKKGGRKEGHICRVGREGEKIEKSGKGMPSYWRGRVLET